MTLHNAVQRGEWAIYIADKFSENQYELMKSEICQSDYMTKSYWAFNGWIKGLSRVIKKQIDIEGNLFGIMIKSAGNYYDRIKFSGELSQESKNYILRQNHKASIVIWLLMFVTLSAILLFIGYKAKIIIFLIPFIVLLAIFVLIIIIFPNVDTPPKNMEQYYPINVNISDDEISFENITFDSYCCRKISDIKKL